MGKAQQMWFTAQRVRRGLLPLRPASLGSAKAFVRQQDTVMRLVRLGTKNHCSGEGYKQFSRLTVRCMSAHCLRPFYIAEDEADLGCFSVLRIAETQASLLRQCPSAIIIPAIHCIPVNEHCSTSHGQ
jgi:hypothetical protein